MSEERASDALRGDVLAHLQSKKRGVSEGVARESAKIESFGKVPRSLEFVSDMILDAVKEGKLASITAMDCQYLIKFTYDRLNERSPMPILREVAEKEKASGSLLERCLEHRLSEKFPINEAEEVSIEDRTELLKRIAVSGKHVTNLFGRKNG